MRARVALVIVSLAATGAGCTAFVAAELSGTQGTVTTTLGGCFALADNQCGQCIATSCESPQSTHPVSLKQVCSLDKYNSIVTTVQQCSQDPRLANYNCQEMYIDGGTYASSIADESAATSNLQHCITDNCATACSACGAQVPTCGSETINLVEAGACGACLNQAMNAPGSTCQPYVIKGGCDEYSGSPIAQCAIPSSSCQAADCSGLKTPSTSLDDAGYALYACLYSACQGTCPSN
jgi:hypothetical protein